MIIWHVIKKTETLEILKKKQKFSMWYNLGMYNSIVCGIYLLDVVPNIPN